jgi:sigma-B regulation protein RsbU (phosphoserine phosphatase)
VDSLLLLGIQDEKLSNFLRKLGYNVVDQEPDKPIPDLLSGNVFDLIILEERLGISPTDICQFFRTEEATKQVPILYVGCDENGEKSIVDSALSKITTVKAPYKLGALVSKIATELRMRKFAGKDEETASIGEINSRLRELNERFTKEMAEARDIQMSLVPTKLPKSEYFDVACSYQPLEEVGGDWFNVQVLADGKLSVQIADVTGHGLSAAFIACITKLAVNAAAKEKPSELLAEMNRLMAPIIPGGKFVTIFSYLFDPETGTLEYARGGHPPALLVKRKAQQVKQLKGQGFAIGFFEEAEYSSESEPMDVGDVIMIYSDVLPESQNMKGDTYDYDRMSKVLLNSPLNTSSAQLLQSVLNDFDEFRDGRLIKDDVTVVVMRRVK